MLSRLRSLVREADPEVVEEWKWRGVPVWEHDGIICTGEHYKNVVKMTFAKGAALKDPAEIPIGFARDPRLHLGNGLDDHPLGKDLERVADVLVAIGFRFAE
jgi:hypothetical protein